MYLLIRLFWVVRDDGMQAVFSLCFPCQAELSVIFLFAALIFQSKLDLMTYLSRSEQLLKSDCCCRPPHAQTPTAYRNEHIITSTVSVSSLCIFMFKPGPR